MFDYLLGIDTSLSACAPRLSRETGALVYPRQVTKFRVEASTTFLYADLGFADTSACRSFTWYDLDPLHTLRSVTPEARIEISNLTLKQALSNTTHAQISLLMTSRHVSRSIGPF